MTFSVPLEDKQLFVRWFLKHYELKCREGVWMLNYLLSNDEALENVHFVEDAEVCPRAIVLSTVDYEDTYGLPLRFHKGHLLSTDAEKAFHELRLNPHEHMYIELQFPTKPRPIYYLAVLEDNPYAVQPSQVSPHHVSDSDMQAALYGFQYDKLRAQIDDALDQGDKERFLELTKLLQIIEK